ncbi:hypothetical protein PIB30_033157 [Stylosanthes scabra]|uniref:Uncharacterized protein n=1 Tax=Stylosanthes scabra TaxID=79078 RepID=A0ABU6YCM6_9FABA|nr:hypothetical protein [Stylosanthes scabra]
MPLPSPSRLSVTLSLRPFATQSQPEVTEPVCTHHRSSSLFLTVFHRRGSSLSLTSAVRHCEFSPCVLVLVFISVYSVSESFPPPRVSAIVIIGFSSTFSLQASKPSHPVTAKKSVRFDRFTIFDRFLTGLMPIGFRIRTGPDKGPVPGFTGRTGRSGPIFRTLFFTAKSNKNTENRSKQTCPHWMGNTNFGIVRKQLRESKENHEEPTRAEMFTATRTSKKGKEVYAKTQVVIDAIQHRIEAGEDDEDAFISVLGKDQPGRLRCYGETITKSSLKEDTIRNLLFSDRF